MPRVEVPDGFLSDESSFYGDEDDVTDMADRMSQFNPQDYWEVSRTSFSFSATAVSQRGESTAHQNVSIPGRDLLEQKATSRHPHDGKPECWQATESIAEFLHRLPPSVTKVSDIGPWIRMEYRDMPCKLMHENIGDLKDFGGRLLRDFEAHLSTLQEEYKSSQSRGVVTQKINADRRKLEASLLQAARDCNVIVGKWMLFPSPDVLDETWAAVAGATAKGRLGVGAKVATDSGDGRNRLVAIYTRDFADKEDIRRVLVQLVDMGIVSKKSAIYYKCDAYTWLDIMGGNIWGLKPSMHSSTDILARKW